MGISLRTRPVSVDRTADPVEPPVSALAVVRIGRSRDVKVLDWALSLRGEHGAAVSVIGVWMPSWLQCISCTSPAGAASSFMDERIQCEAWWSERCAEASVQFRFVGLSGACPAIVAELGCRPHGFLVVARSAVSARMALTLRRRHPGLRVVRV